MKKLLAIILAVVCIIPTMAVSFSVSAKAATNNVNSKDAFMYQYSEKTYTVKKTKAQQKYKFNYSVSNNKDNSVIVVKNNDKTKFQVTIGGNKETSANRPVVSVYYKNGSKKVVVQKYVVKVAKYKFQNINMGVGRSDSVDYKFPANAEQVSFIVKNKKVSTFTRENHLTYWNGSGEYQFKVNALSKGTTPVSFYANKSFFKNSKCFKPDNRLLCTFNVNVGNYRPQLKINARNLKLHYSKVVDLSKHNEQMNELYNLYVDIPSMLYNVDSKAKAQYRIETKDKKSVVSVNGNNLDTKSLGKATYTLYSKTNNRELVIGTFTVQVTDIPMGVLADYNTIEYDDGIFYNDQIGVKKGGTVDAFKTIKQKVLTDSYTGINFKPADYKITYKIKDTSIATVNSKGVIKGKKVGDTRFEFTIKFSDGSTFSDFAELGVLLNLVYSNN